MKMNEETENKEQNLQDSLKDKLSGLPTGPGIYQYKNSVGKVIYVGKAKNLRNRVRSYFQAGKPQDAKTKAMISHICDLEVILVDSEAEAFLLEDNLIKSLKPKYNILLRDDKTYPYIRVTNEPFPRIFPTRKVIRDGSKYYGPYTEVRHIKYLIRALRTIFQVRSCDLKLSDESIAKKKFRVCLDYHIKKCQGPCEAHISKDEYNTNIKMAMQILTGKTRDLEKRLENEMYELSEKMEFEKAALVRNRLSALQDFTSKQKIVSPDLIDRDVFGICKKDDIACSIVLKIRDGKLLGKKHYIIKNAELESEEEIIERTIERWYMETDFIPKELFLPCEADQLEYVLDWLGKRKGKAISVQIPKLGDKRKIVDMANSNAEFILAEYQLAITKREQTVPRPVVSLQRDLRMKKPPMRIECFDNSHIQGTDYVSSLVVFEDGKPKKSEYRKFKIRSFEGNNDFAAMQEVVSRRYSRLVEEKQALPDLVIIDGGKGQLSAACEILSELNILNDLYVIGLAKRLEEVFVPGEKEAILLPKTSSSLKLLQNVRDEAHRFAITYHRSLRDKRTLTTELTEIKGIGKAISTKLLTKLGSVENIKKASKDELLQYVTAKQADAIIEFFHTQNEASESVD